MIHAVNLAILIITWFLKAEVFLKFWFIHTFTILVEEKNSKFRDYKYSDTWKLLGFYLRCIILVRLYEMKRIVDKSLIHIYQISCTSSWGVFLVYSILFFFFLA